MVTTYAITGEETHGADGCVERRETLTPSEVAASPLDAFRSWMRRKDGAQEFTLRQLLAISETVARRTAVLAARCMRTSAWFTLGRRDAIGPCRGCASTAGSECISASGRGSTAKRVQSFWRAGSSRRFASSRTRHL